MGQFDSYLRCTVGGTHFQLEDYSASVSAMVEQGTGRVGTQKSVTGTGWIEAATVNDYTARLADAQANLNSSGQDFTIYALGGNVEFQITAAECIDGGPHASYDLLEQKDESGCYRKIRFTVTGQTANTGGGGGDDGVSSWKEGITTNASSLRRITRSGEVNATDAVSVFQSSVLAPFRSAYPLPNWVVTHHHEYDQVQRKLSYTLQAEALASPLPQAGGVNVVDGRPNKTFTRDERGRTLYTWTFDLILDSPNYGPVLDLIRQGFDAANGPIVRESFDFDATRELRLRATFEGVWGDGNDLVSWNQRLEFADGSEVWRELRHPRVEPLLVKADNGFVVLIQQGTAVGMGKWPKPPAPLFADALLAEPVVSFDTQSMYEFVTAWRYVMAATDVTPWTVQATHLATLIRPSEPEFIGP